MWSYIIIHAAPVLSVHGFKSFKASLVKVFQNNRTDCLTLECVTEFANGQQNGEPYSQSEVSAATTKMVDANQILVAEGMMFLIQGDIQKFLDNCYNTQITSYMDMIYFYSSKYIPPWSIHVFACSFNFFMPSRKAVFEIVSSSLVTAHWISSTVWKCRPFKQTLTWGRESSRQVQDLASKVGGGEQHLSCSPETSLQLQRYVMSRYREEGKTHLIGILPF